MKVFILGLFLSLVGCGEERFIDPALQPLLDEYIALCSDHEACSNRHAHEVTTMKFDLDMEKGTNGVCNQNSWEKDITIRPQGEKTIEYFKTIVFHELGHCMHGLKHDPKSPIMSARGYSSIGTFEADLNEFFDHQMEVQK